jgi:homocysteine S-methyltransferase
MPLLPQLGGDLWVTDGGLETTMMFVEGIDLPDFAAFALLDRPDGREALVRYYGAYLDLAEGLRTGIVVDTPTWRANLDWGARLGYDPVHLESINRRAVRLVADLVVERPVLQAVVSGVIGPRGDRYVVGAAMSVTEAANYHLLQARAFASAGAGMITGVTMSSAEEAAGVARAADTVGVPVVVSFTVETDGRLPSGQALGDAIESVDEVTDAVPAYYMVDCAHPTHFQEVLASGGSWVERVRAVRAHASRMSHAELDRATELDRSAPAELARHYADLRRLLPWLAVVGGCCGTDAQHVATIAAVLTSRS